MASAVWSFFREQLRVVFDLLKAGTLSQRLGRLVLSGQRPGTARRKSSQSAAAYTLADVALLLSTGSFPEQRESWPQFPAHSSGPAITE